MDNTRICYVCGFDFDSEVGDERQEWPFIFCTCCLFEYGFEDLEWDCFTRKREVWIQNGLPFSGKLVPENISWTLPAALKQLNQLKLLNLVNNNRGYELNPNFTCEVDTKKVILCWERARKA